MAFEANVRAYAERRCDGYGDMARRVYSLREGVPVGPALFEACLL